MNKTVEWHLPFLIYYLATALPSIHGGTHVEDKFQYDLFSFIDYIEIKPDWHQILKNINIFLIFPNKIV